MSRAAPVRHDAGTGTRHAQDVGRIRDAARSRQAILDTAERLFSERGFDGVSLGDIAATVGLSRAMPSYLFGNKDALYTAVLQRVFHDRQAATAAAVAPIGRVVRSRGRPHRLAPGPDCRPRRLHDVPALAPHLPAVHLVGGTRRGQAAAVNRAALHGAHRRIHRPAPRRRRTRASPVHRPERRAALGDADLRGTPHRHTMLAGIGRDLTDARIRREHTDFVADQLMFLLTGGSQEVEE